MHGKEVYIRALSAWVPGLEGREEYVAWSGGKRELPAESDRGSLPSLDFVPSMQRRRMTALSKLAVALIHGVQDDLTPLAKIYFVSQAGESGRQFQVNAMVLQDGEVSPAAFSTSVFNTPPAMASILLRLANGYSALYPGKGKFFSGIQCALAPLLAGNCSQILLVYADVAAPEEYASLDGAIEVSWGFAALLENQAGGIPVDVSVVFDGATASPKAVFHHLLASGVDLSCV